jgi:hypothetical protein
MQMLLDGRKKWSSQGAFKPKRRRFFLLMKYINSLSSTRGATRLRYIRFFLFYFSISVYVYEYTALLSPGKLIWPPPIVDRHFMRSNETDFILKPLLLLKEILIIIKPKPCSIYPQSSQIFIIIH